MTRTFVALLGLSASALVLAAGCSGASIAEYCKNFCACTKCVGGEEKQCESDTTESQQAAAKASCSSEFQDFLDCLASASCKGDMLDEQACLAEEKAALECQSAPANP